MKSIFTIPCLLLFSFTNAQIFNPVSWETNLKEIDEGLFELSITAKIESGWHLYDTENRENGPFPTSLDFEIPKNSSLFGDLKRQKPIIKYDSIFEMNVGYYENQTRFTQKIKLQNPLDSINVLISFMACDEKRCLPPKEVLLSFNGKEVLKKPIKKEQQIEVDSGDLLSIFLLAFLFGFTALLTPCVFPMIPLTVSFFTKQSKNKLQGIRNALLFGVSIVFIYVFLGILITMIFGSGALNALATNIWFNLFMFILLGLFAFSFLGAFEINLPNSWANSLDKKSSKKGFVGIFFMALALAVISFSCTGPIVGTLLVQAATGQNLLGPIIGMFGFSMAIAIPFTLFAAFPGWMNSLPKSGSWLQTVKVVLGFLELAFALKFLSNIDLVLQLEILNREVFLSIWLAIFMCLTMYLFGFILLPHHAPSSAKTPLSLSRLSIALLSLSFTLYLIPGLWGAPLKLISAFPPPLNYSESSPIMIHNSKSELSNQKLPAGSHLLAPYNILSFNDYETALSYSKKEKKPLLIDFTGHACVNCRKMEQLVWSNPKVLDVLRNEVVLVSLYVDDKRKLNENEFFESKLRPGHIITQIGEKWAEFQAINFNANAQPYYVMMDNYEKQINNAFTYTSDPELFFGWLEKGIN